MCRCIGALRTDIGPCHILYGVEAECPAAGHATVRGLHCSHKARDELRCRFTQSVVGRIVPPIACRTVSVHFMPVADSNTGQPIDDLFVLGMLNQHLHRPQSTC